MDNKFFKHYKFKGTHYEIGRLHGEALREEIQKHLAITYELALNVSNISKDKALETARLFEPYIEKYSPGFLEEIAGLGEGANISATEALLLQIRQEVVYLTKYGVGGFECTSYAIGPEYTADGKMYSGQNADLAGDFESVSNIITFAVNNKPQVMMLVPAGQISYLGMNDEGMSANCNFLSCQGWKKGYPRYLISRLLLEQRSFEEACAKLAALTERASSRNILLADYKGNIADFETTSEDYGRIDAKELFVHSNHFIDSHMRRYERGGSLELLDSEWRLKRFSDLVEANKGKIEAEMIKSFLSDEEKDSEIGKFSICMHACKETENYHTFASIVNNLTDRVMEVTRGNPCSHPYKAYDFN